MMTNLFRVCAFFVALLLFSFQKMKRAICISVGTAAGVVTVLICWCIINSWDSGDEDSENDELIDYEYE
jgi:heme O synthase-like polyprenyltransferase